MGTCCLKHHLPDVDSTPIGDKMSFFLLILLYPLKPMKLK